MKTLPIILVFLLFVMVFQINADTYKIYSDATKEYVVHNATVKVLDDKGNQITTGRTDINGEVSFNIQAGIYTGIIMFQGKEYTFTMESLNEPDATHEIYLTE